jgi:phenylacetate-coenzyme A ligase PaaK-like adenylate-forming protein
MIHPNVLGTLLKAWLRSKRNGRKILPMDLWPTKAIMVGGMDAHIYRDSIKHYWGREPYQFYISSEAFYLAMHSWNKRYMTFVPDMVFLEFIPLDELRKEEENKHYRPKTVLLNEVKERELYEIVISHFYGMPLLRYRLRDLIKIEALQDEESGIFLPQMLFQRRVDEAINIGGLAQLDEKTIWQAMANIGLKYTEWTAFKEFDQDKSILRLCIELTEPRDSEELEKVIDEQLKLIDTDYKDISYYLGMTAVRISVLSRGTFQRFMEEKVKEGADQAHIKPAHINPPESVSKRLLGLSAVEE